MKQAQGWAQVIKFNALKKPEQLTPQQQAQHTVCSFANEFIDIFNTNPLSTRLKCLASLYMMVNMLALAAFTASCKKLPYVEPTQFESEENGKLKPLFYLSDEKPSEVDE